MKRIAVYVGTLTLFANLAFAQRGVQSWSGMLVAAGCQANSRAPRHARSANEGAADMARSTPTVNTREQNRPFEQQANQADRSTAASTSDPAQVRDKMKATDQVKTPPVDSVDTRGSAPLDGPALGASANDASCQISGQTNAFALRLSDGRLVRFDDASNAKIVQQLGGRSKKSKTFHARVKGTLNGDTIGMNSIRM